MRFRFALPLLCLLSTPISAASEPAAAVLRAGTVEIVHDPAAVSFLPVDSEALKSLLCNGFPPNGDWAKLSPRGECDLTVDPPGKMFLVTGGGTSIGSAARVSVQPTSWDAWHGSAPVATSCGLWDVAVELDPKRTQPVSELALEPSAMDPAQGVFAGTLRLAALYRFANRDKATVTELPAALSLELSGHWALAPEGAPGLGDGASNLVLFAGIAAGQGFAAPSCATWGGLRCKVCLQPAPEALEMLSPGFPP